MRQRKDGIETKQKILESAAPAFAKYGYHQTKIADICRDAGSNVAAVNYYFGSKDKLYTEAWRYVFEKSIIAYPPDGEVSASASPEERLKGQISALIKRLMDPNSLDLDIAHKDMSQPTGLLRDVMHSSLEPLRMMFMANVRELLGPNASEEQVQWCEMSIHFQCFGPLMRRRHAPPKDAQNGPPRKEPWTIPSASALAEHIFRFSLAGLREIRNDNTSKCSPS